MLSKIVQEIIENNVKKAFQNLRLNLLGPDKISKAVVFSIKNFDPLTTLASAYLHANSLNSIDDKSVDKDTINKLKDVAEKYIDNLEQKSIADVTRVVSEKIDNITTKAKTSGKTTEEILKSSDGREILRDLKSALKEQREKISSAADLIVNHELHNAQNFGAFDGLLSASKAANIQDPVVFKIGVMDEKRCKHCWRLWTLEDKITPKVYRLSELSGSSGHWKNPDASISPTHPNCRDILTVLMPGFGFVNGKVTYLGKDHDEYKKQRS